LINKLTRLTKYLKRIFSNKANSGQMSSISDIEYKFKEYLNILSSEVRQADIHYKIFKGLFDSRLEDENVEAMNIAPNFFSQTEYSHDICTLICMCKVFDQHRNSINIKNLVNYVEGNKDVFDKYGFDECNELVRQIFEDYQTEIENLKTWRDKHIVHLDKNTKYSASHLETNFPVNPNKYEELIRFSMDILNCYSAKLLGKTYFAAQTLAVDDYKKVLEAIKKRS